MYNYRDHYNYERQNEYKMAIVSLFFNNALKYKVFRYNKILFVR